MKFDETIAWRLNQMPPAAHDETDVEALIKNYEVVCILSTTASTRPQVLARVAHWEKKAAKVREFINRLLEKYPVPPPKLKNQTRENIVLPNPET